MLGLIRQMRIANRGENRVMPEDSLDLDEVDAGLDQVSGIGVPQTVRRNLFFDPQESTTAFRAFWTPPRSSGVFAVRAPAGPP